MQPLIAKPGSILVLGWSTITASVLMIVVNSMSLVSFGMVDNFNLDQGLLAQYVPESMQKVMDLYSYSKAWTWYGILFFAYVLIAGIQFARLREQGRKMLEIACWVGMVNAFVDTTISYMIWKNMQDALSMAMRGVGGGQYSFVNPLGLLMIVLGFFLWIIPSGLIIIYLRRPVIRQAFRKV